MPEFLDIQNSFNQGELGPLLYGRGDLPAYQAGMKTVRNWIPLRTGGLERRSGSLFVVSLIDPSKKGRLVDFHVNNEASYDLVLEENFFQVLTRGGVLLLADITPRVDGIDFTPMEVFSPLHGYYHGSGPFRMTPSPGDILPGGLVEGIDYYVVLPRKAIISDSIIATDVWNAPNIYTDKMGPFRLSTSGTLPPNFDARTDYWVRNPTASGFQLSTSPSGSVEDVTAGETGQHTLTPEPSYLREKFRLSTSVDVTDTIVFSAGGDGSWEMKPTGQQPSRFALPYTESQIQDLTYALSADTMFFCVGTHPPTKIVRFGPQVWESTTVTFADGPWLQQQELTPGDFATGVTCNPAANAGDRVEIVASAAIFKGTDLGRQFRYSDDDLKFGYGVIIGIDPFTFVDTDVYNLQILNIDIHAGNDQLHETAHARTTGEAISFTGTSDGGITVGIFYYVKFIDVDHITLHPTEIDANNDTNRVDITDIGWTAKQIISSWLSIIGPGSRHGPLLLSTTGTLPAGLSPNTPYFMESPTSDRIFFTHSLGGPIVMITDNIGGGLHTIEGETIPSNTCDVEIRDDFLGSNNSELTWHLGAWGADPALGYPETVVLHEQRTWWGGNRGLPQTLWSSQSGNLLLMSPDEPSIDSLTIDERIIVDSSGITFDLVSEQNNQIQWMLPIRQLIVGTTGGIWNFQATTQNEALTPSNKNARRQSNTGSNSVKPAVESDVILFIGANNRTVMSARFEFDRDAIVPTDLMLLAEHLTEEFTVTDLAFSSEPLDVLWVRRSDGILLSCTYDPSQNVAAWGTHDYDGDVESVGTSSSENGRRDQVWTIVKRTVDGKIRRDIEVLAPRFLDSTPIEEAHFVDAGIHQTDVAGKTVWTGLNHLEGVTVSIWADGGQVADKVVSGNQITLDMPAKEVHIGRAIDDLCELLPVEAPVNDQGGRQNLAFALKRISDAQLRIYITSALRVGRDESSLQELDLRNLITDTMDSPVDLFSGVIKLPVGSGYEDDGGFAWSSSGAAPAKVLSSALRVDWANA